MSISLAVLIVRLLVGLLLIGHGAQKLFGWFGGNGLSKTMQFLQAKGFKYPGFWALLGSVGELGGGLLLALGFLGPLGALGVFASMLMAVIKFHWGKGLWGTTGGFEYPLVLLVLSVVLGLLGPGSYSVDALLGIALPTTLLFGIGALAAVIVDAIGVVTSATSAVPAQTQAVSGHT